MRSASFMLGFLAILNEVQITWGAPTTAEGLPDSPVTPPCVNPPKRKEWRQLSRTQKKDYIDAVLCLTTKPAISSLPGTLNRFDDHQAVHQDQKPYIHWVGHFLLWHRYFVATFEKALREECAYAGAQPYWDWSLDATPSTPDSLAFASSPVFDPITGFGGNGPKVEPSPAQNPFNLAGGTGGGCVEGPFAPPAFRVNIPVQDCLRRDFVPWLFNSWADPALVAGVVAQGDYAAFARAVEGVRGFGSPNVHGSAHFGIGGVLGQLGDAANSSADPLFYLHHGNLDHVFWRWQQGDRERRLSEVGGPVAPLDYGGVNVTLGFRVGMGALAGERELRELLDTEGGALCYTYEV